MILVVGATGYVGRYLCTFLVNKGYDILALGRSKKVKRFFDENNVPFRYFDLNDDSSFEGLPENVDAIVDLSACLAELETPVEEFFRVNTLGVYKILEYARKKDIKKVVVTSTHKVYNDVYNPELKPLSEKVRPSFRGDHTPYIISKIAAENFVEYYNKDFGMNAVVLRLTGVHGYGEILGHLDKDGSYRKSTFEIFFESALRGDDIFVWGDQTIKRDHVYIKDVLTAIEAAVNSKECKGIFNIASGVGYSQYDEACSLARIFANEKMSEVILCPEKVGLKRGYIYDISKAKSELKWEPKFTDLDELYADYKKEWLSKKYHNYHFIKDDERPMTF